MLLQNFNMDIKVKIVSFQIIQNVPTVKSTLVDLLQTDETLRNFD